MNTANSSACNAPAAQSYVWARQQLTELHTGVCVALHLDATGSGLAWGTGQQPSETAELALGLQALADRFFPAERMSLLAVEEAIAHIEDIVMPWHGHWPTSAQLLACDSHITALDTWVAPKFSQAKF